MCSTELLSKKEKVKIILALKKKQKDLKLMHQKTLNSKSFFITEQNETEKLNTPLKSNET